jgi:hypothetical protein
MKVVVISTTRKPGWLTAYCVGCTVWMRNNSIHDFRERLEYNGKTVFRIVRGFQKELT